MVEAVEEAKAEGKAVAIGLKEKLLEAHKEGVLVEAALEVALTTLDANKAELKSAKADAELMAAEVERFRNLEVDAKQGAAEMLLVATAREQALTAELSAAVTRANEAMVQASVAQSHAFVLEKERAKLEQDNADLGKLCEREMRAAETTSRRLVEVRTELDESKGKLVAMRAAAEEARAEEEAWSEAVQAKEEVRAAAERAEGEASGGVGGEEAAIDAREGVRRPSGGGDGEGGSEVAESRASSAEERATAAVTAAEELACRY